MTAYEAAVRAVARALERDFAVGSTSGDPFDREARSALAALATNPDVRAALVETLSATTSAEVGGEPVTDVYRPEGLVVLLLAALRPPEAT